MNVLCKTFTIFFSQGTKRVNVISEHILSPLIGASAKTQKYSSFTDGIRASVTTLDLLTEPTEDKVEKFLDNLPECNIYNFVCHKHIQL